MVSLAWRMALITMVASGLEEKDISEDFAGEQVEHEAVLSADENQVIVENSTQVSYNSLTAIAKEVPADNATAMMEWNIGAPVPPPVLSFPGCHCDWNEPGWTCEGSAVYPRSMEGEKCCCCGIHCKRGRRCTDDQCMTIGIDQGDEVREEERKFAEMLKNADFLMGDDLPAKVVELEKGVCNTQTIINACKRAGMTPVCDHTSYISTNACYTPGIKGTKFFNRHFSHWNGHRQHMGFDDDVEAQFHGMCFLTNNHGNALGPIANSHAWMNNANSKVPANVKAKAKGMKDVYQRDLNACKPKEQGGIGCWRTLCVPREPNLAEAKSTGSYR